MSADDQRQGWLHRWEELSQDPGFRTAGVVVGLMAAATVLWLPRPDGLSPQAQAVAAVAIVMAGWWVTDVVPRAVTSMIPLVAFPLLGISSVSDAAAPYAHPLIYLMLGGFVIGHAMEEVGFHKRLTAWLLAPEWVRSSPRRVLGAMMVAAAALSGLVSNTATTLMMLPLAFSLAAACACDRRRTSGFVLGLAYAASIGGLTTLVGTPPNAVLAAFAPDMAGVDVGFAQWMGVGIPIAIGMVPVAWWAVAHVSFDLPRQFEAPLELPTASPWTRQERHVVGVVIGAMALWLTRSPKTVGSVDIPGWGQIIAGKGSELDAGVAILAALVLFAIVVPADAERHQPSSMLLSWQKVEAATPWSVLLLLGGGFSLATAIKGSGLTDWLASGAGGLAEWPLPFSMAFISFAMTFLTEITSNTATSQIVLPILAEAANAFDVEPMMWMIPAAMSASCAFMIPVATPPNAIAAEAGHVSAADMASTGLVINLVGVVVVSALSYVFVPLVF